MRDLKADLELCHGFAQELETAKYRTWGALNATYDFAHKAREGWPHAIERALKAEALVRELTDALKKIAYPWVYLQKEAEKNNCRLDGAMAYQLGNDAYWLKSEARTALDKIKEVLGDEVYPSKV